MRYTRYVGKDALLCAVQDSHAQARTPHPVVVVHEAAPVEQVEHGLEAEEGLLGHVGHVGQHPGPGCQLHRLVILCPCHLLKPHLQGSQHLASSTAKGWLSTLRVAGGWCWNEQAS